MQKKDRLKMGTWFVLLNDRGECELIVSVGQNVLSGVVVQQGLWADQKGKKHLVNGSHLIVWQIWAVVRRSFPAESKLKNYDRKSQSFAPGSFL